MTDIAPPPLTTETVSEKPLSKDKPSNTNTGAILSNIDSVKKIDSHWSIKRIILLVGISILSGAIAGAITAWGLFPILLDKQLIQLPSLKIGTTGGGFISIGTTTSKMPYISLVDSSGHSKISMQLDKNTAPSIDFYAVTGKPTMSLISSEDGSGLILFNGDKTCLSVASIKNKGNCIEFYGSDDKAQFQLHCNGQNNSLALYDKDGKQRLVLGNTTLTTEKTGTTTSTAVSTLTLFDTKGKVISKLPFFD